MYWCGFQTLYQSPVLRVYFLISSHAFRVKISNSAHALRVGARKWCSNGACTILRRPDPGRSTKSSSVRYFIYTKTNLKTNPILVPTGISGNVIDWSKKSAWIRNMISESSLLGHTIRENATNLVLFWMDWFSGQVQKLVNAQPDQKVEVGLTSRFRCWRIALW